MTTKHEEVSQQLASNNEAWDNAFNNNQLSTLFAMYDQAATVIPAGGEPVHGLDAISSFWKGMKDNGVDGHALTVKTAHIEPNIAIQHGKWGAGVTAASGERQNFQGNVHIVHRRQPEGDWKILTHIWN